MISNERMDQDWSKTEKQHASLATLFSTVATRVEGTQSFHVHVEYALECQQEFLC